MTSTSLVVQKPKNRGGRPPGTPNAATRKRQMEALRGGEAPKAVMLRTMRHYYRKAEKFENALEGDLIAWLSAPRS
jgi:hypothetical protein